MFKTVDLFDLSHTLAAELIKSCDYPWQALAKISSFILSLKNELGTEYVEVSPSVWVHKSAKIAQSAYLGAPCVVGENTEVRQGAFIRGSALIGDDCVIGNSCEIKNAVLFDGVQVPHFNYIGDSILGYKCHFGAGAITSNVKSDKGLVEAYCGTNRQFTGLKKLGAMVGDFAEIGCNSVLNPGAVVGRNSIIYPLSCVRGTVPENSILKSGGVIVKKR